MANLVCDVALLQCSFGLSEAFLKVLPANRTKAEFMAAATVMDHVPMTNIPSFGMCNTPSNPAVASATTAANGVLTPQPCVPVTTDPWIPGSPTVTIGGIAALNSTSKCLCKWGGEITVDLPGTFKTNVA